MDRNKQFLTELLAATEQIERTVENFNDEIDDNMLLELSSVARKIQSLIATERFVRNSGVDIATSYKDGILVLGGEKD